MAVPVKKTSKTEKNIRRNSKKRKFFQYVYCPHCQEAKSPHVVCVKCGYYNKKKILSVTTS